MLLVDVVSVPVPVVEVDVEPDVVAVVLPLLPALPLPPSPVSSGVPLSQPKATRRPKSKTPLIQGRL
jgi:hypothetical protein